MTPDKYVWPPGSVGQSTPWAVQFREDMDELAQVDESMSVWFNARSSDLDIFIPGTEAHDRWSLVDPHILGNTKKRRKVGPEGQVEEEDMVDEEVALGELEKPYWCDHQEGGGGTCGKRFSSISALKGHVREARNIRDALSNIVITNQCPWCLSGFSTRRVALDHCVRACQRHGVCHVDKS
eukprot:3213042-Pyramimonas_sp.AAC.1